MDGPPQAAQLVNRIRICEQQPAPARLLRRRPDGVGLARPALLQLPCRQHCNSCGLRELAGNLPRPVRRIVIDDDQLPVHAQLEDLLRLADQRLKAVANAVFLIACRDNDGELDERIRLRLVKDRACAPVELVRRRGLARIVKQAQNRLVRARANLFLWLRPIFAQDEVTFRSVL